MVQKAIAKDLNQIYTLISNASKKGSVLYRPKSEIKKFLPTFYVYKVNNIVVGCASLEIYNSRLAEIRSLVVDPKHAKKGIGAKLVAKCVSGAKDKNIQKLLAVTDKDKFFTKQGFGKCLNEQWAMFINFNK
jgi:N-acetylglutamate synthase-like GNAT family acetyltransferase